MVDPAEFKFETVVEDDGKGPSGGWRQTECITIRFLRSPSFLRPVEFFDVRFRVGAPIRNHRGRIPEWFAVDKSVEAATAAGLELIAMLRAGTASQADAQIVFPKKMTLFLQGSNPGALSTGCSASGKKLGVTLQM